MLNDWDLFLMHNLFYKRYFNQFLCYIKSTKSMIVSMTLRDFKVNYFPLMQYIYK